MSPPQGTYVGGPCYGGHVGHVFGALGRGGRGGRRRKVRREMERKKGEIEIVLRSEGKEERGRSEGRGERERVGEGGKGFDRGEGKEWEMGRSEGRRKE